MLDPLPWATRLDDLLARDIDTLLVQWTRHDEALFSHPTNAEDWLAQRIAQASEQGMQLVLGLYAQSDYFKYINQTFDAAYWANYIAANHSWAQSVLANHHDFQPLAFYFPGELSDYVLTNPSHLSTIRADLIALQQALQRPLWLSTFYTGHSPLGEYQHALAQLQQDTQLRVLHQDGAGSRLLSQRQVEHVINQLDCQFMLVGELFIQSDDGMIAGLKHDHITALTAQSPPCPQHFWFSLRYLQSWGF